MTLYVVAQAFFPRCKPNYMEDLQFMQVKSFLVPLYCTHWSESLWRQCSCLSSLVFSLPKCFSVFCKGNLIRQVLQMKLQAPSPSVQSTGQRRHQQAVTILIHLVKATVHCYQLGTRLALVLQNFVVDGLCHHRQKSQLSWFLLEATSTSDYQNHMYLHWTV